MDVDAAVDGDDVVGMYMEFDADVEVPGGLNVDYVDVCVGVDVDVWVVMYAYVHVLSCVAANVVVDVADGVNVIVDVDVGVEDDGGADDGV